jgi:hypothetical protein
MRKLITWAVVTLGVAALVRKLRRRSGAAETPAAPEEEDPAAELRRKLAETRDDEMPFPGAAPELEPTVDERRAEVHAHARAAVDEMQKSNEG